MKKYFALRIVALVVSLSYIFSFDSFAQTMIQIKGKVTDETSSPIIGAGIVANGTTTGAVTDVDGNYSITVPAGTKLIFSCLGYLNQTIEAGNLSTTINVILKEDSTLLDEVVMIGYGTAKKSSLTGALSQVSSDSFKDQKVTRVDQALQGRASGVQVSNTVGAPGGDVRIRIRGANSVLGDNSPLFVIDGFVGADFNSINPNDIKSMEVLKDASSTAIYGSRGANGVVLITTKSGSTAGNVHVTYDGSVTASSMIKNYDLLSAAEYAQAYNEHNLAFGTAAIYSQEQIAELERTGGYDYLGAILRTAVSHQHQISVDGGNDRTQYRVSANYLNQPGIVKESGYNRFNVRASLNSKINDRFKVRFNINTSSSKGKNNNGYSGASTVINQAIAWNPTMGPYKEDGVTLRMNDTNGSLKANPLALLYDKETLNEKTFITMLGGANYEFFKGFSADVQVAGDLTYLTSKNWTGNTASMGSPSASIFNSQSKTIQTTSQLSYVRTFGKHDISAVAAVETQSYKYNSQNAEALGLIFPDLKYDNLSQSSTQKVSSGYSMWTLLSFIGRVNYSYGERYLASLSVRHDGSSKFAPGNKFSTFPAAALAWNIAKENFMEDVDVISKLKIRASWGLTGSQAISPYATMSAFNNVTYPFTPGSSSSGIQAGDPSNLELKWETTSQTDIGLDFGLFNDRLTVEADYYIKDTRDLLLNKSVPNYQGGGSVVSNIGSIRNSGFDFAITGKIIEKKDLALESTVNVSFLKNKVLDLGDQETVYVASNLTGINDGMYDFIYQVGQPLGTIYGLKYLGPWKKSEAAEAAEYGMVPGDARYEDLDNNKVIDASDYQIIGYGMPKVTLGWNTNFAYKGLSVNMFWQGAFGNDKLNYNRCINMMASRDVTGARFSEIKDRWTEENQDAFLPAWNPSSKWYPVSSLWLEKGGYLRLKNLSIAYNFDVKKVGNFTVSLNSTNLLTITKYKGIDPEASNVGGGTSDIMQGLDYGSYPNSRSFTLGLNIRF